MRKSIQTSTISQSDPMDDILNYDPKLHKIYQDGYEIAQEELDNSNGKI